MEDFFEDLYDEPENGQEPSFSLGDFKKWLARQKKDKKTETKAENSIVRRPDVPAD